MVEMILDAIDHAGHYALFLLVLVWLIVAVVFLGCLVLLALVGVLRWLKRHLTRIERRALR